MSIHSLWVGMKMITYTAETLSTIFRVQLKDARNPFDGAYIIGAVCIDVYKRKSSPRVPRRPLVIPEW